MITLNKNADQQMIVTLAEILDESDPGAAEFYTSVSVALQPCPSIYSLTYWAKIGYSPGMTVDDFITYLLEKDHSLSRANPHLVISRSKPSLKPVSNQKIPQSATRKKSTKQGKPENKTPIKKNTKNNRLLEIRKETRAILSEVEKAKQDPNYKPAFKKSTYDIKPKNIFETALSLKISKDLITDVSALLTGRDKWDWDIAIQFLVDLKRIYPKDFFNEDLLLRAIGSCSRHGLITVDKVHDFIRKALDPNADHIHIIYTPMSNSK